MRTIRWIATAGLTLSMLGLAACGDSKDETATPTTKPADGGGIPAALTTVTVSDNKFAPVAMQVPVGATVTWTWTGSARHSVKGNFGGEEINSPTLSGTGVYLFAFQKAGVFEYECGVHGAAMKGTITIQ